MLRHGEDVRTGRLPIPARDAGEAVGDISISTSSGEGFKRSSRRPDSMRCQARGGIALAAI